MSIKHTSKLLNSILTMRVKCALESCKRRMHISVLRGDNLKNNVVEADEMVDYLSRTLITNKPDGMKLFMKKLTGTDHVLIETARNHILNNIGTSYELIVLLLSKAAGVQAAYKKNEYDFVEGILHSQKVLAESVEMLRTAHIIHKSVINSDPGTTHSSTRLGNGVILLSGDHLLATVLSEFLELNNIELTDLMSSGQRDLTESQFLEPRTRQNEPLPCKPIPHSQYVPVPFEFSADPICYKEALGNAESEWILRNTLGGATLLAKGCQGSMLLAGCSQVVQRKAHIFGRNIALAWQASKELRQLSSEDTTEFSLVAAPILFHLQHHPEFYAEFERLKDADNVPIDYGKIGDAVRSGPGIEKTQEMKAELVSGCIHVLDDFDESAAKDTLSRLVQSL